MGNYNFFFEDICQWDEKECKIHSLDVLGRTISKLSGAL